MGAAMRFAHSSKDIRLHLQPGIEDVRSRADAEDLTQEILVKVITSLKTFRHASSIRTWLYRITVNHFLKTRRRAMEITVSDFEDYFGEIAAVPDEEPDASLGITDATVEELRLRCTSGMLMCLDRDQRLAFILGAVFSVPTTVAAEILDITPGNYRVRLHRARRDLGSWMNARCGLVDAKNPCSCRGKTAAYVRQGVVDPARLLFNADYVVRIEQLTRRTARDAMQRVDELHDRFFSSHPFALSKRRWSMTCSETQPSKGSSRWNREGRERGSRHTRSNTFNAPPARRPPR